MSFPILDWEELSLQVMITFGHFLWQACAVAIVFVIAEQAVTFLSGRAQAIRFGQSKEQTPDGLRRSANVRYTLACLAFFSLPLCVMTTFAWVHQSRGPGALSATATAKLVNPAIEISPQPTPVLATTATPNILPVTLPALPEASTSKLRVADTRIASPSSWTGRIGSFASYLLTIYLVCVALLLTRFGVSIVGSSRLRRTIQPITDSQLLNIIAEQSSRLGLKRIPVVALCQRVSVPVVIGVVKPMILLPPVLLCGLDPNQLAAILSHEMAHIRRYDPFINLLQRIVESLLFFHPVTWWISRRVSIERESCCDDMAAIGHGRVEYAAALLRMAEQCASARGLNVAPQLQSLAADGGSTSQLGHRIRRLLGDDHTPRVSLTRRAIAAIAILAMLGFASVVAVAQPADDASDRRLVVAQPAEDASRPEETSTDKSSPFNDETATDPATALGRRVHQRMAAIDGLPSFYLAAKAGTSDDFFLESPSKDPLENLIRSLNAPDGGAKWYRHRVQFGWDEKHFIDSTGDSDSDDVSQFHWGTREIAGERNGRGPEVRHVLMRDAAEMWKHVTPSCPNYMLASRHQFWWGDNSEPNQHLNGANLPVAIVSYQQLPSRMFDGELCEVVQSTARQEILFVSKTTGLLRGYVVIDPKAYPDEFYKSEKAAQITGVKFSSQREYGNWFRENESEVSEQQAMALAAAWSLACDWSSPTASLLVRFRDYRQIAPGVMWPFREDRVQGSMRDGKYECMRTYNQVQEVLINRNLTDKVNAVRPRDGQQVQDQRFHEVVDYPFSNARGESDILKMVDEKHEQRMQDQLFVEGNAKPYEAMIGKQTPGLPGASNLNWVGGTPPALTGKPYLIRFWATWCSSCQDDVPALSQFVNSGGTVIGMHPKADTNDVLRVMKQTKLLHPTFVSDEDSGWYAQKIANYPSPMFPYYLLVDGQGVAVTHGLLSDEESGILAKCRELAAGTTPADQPSQLSDASATDEPPKQPVVTLPKVPDESEMMEVAIRVNYKNQPVAGAMVHPEYYGGLGGNEPTDVEPKLTDATGMATFRLKKQYGENFETKSFHVRARHDDFCYRYEHDAPIENGVITLSLTKGYRVLVDAIDADTKTAITSDIYAGDLHNGIWRRQDDGRLLSPMLRYDRFGNRAIGLTQIRDERVIGFSDLVRVRPLRKQRQVMATKIPIHPPVMLSGELDSRVPRPVRNSRVMVVVKRALRSKSGKVNTWGPEWVDWTPVGSDGTFQFDALPRGGEVELLAICDDEFISSATAVQAMGLGITPGMFLGYLQPMKIQLGNKNKSVTVAMRPMTSAKVRLLDPQSKPVDGANVMARPHHRWNSHLGQPLFHSLRSRDILLGREPGPTYRESPSGITDENGIATLESIIPGSYMVTVKHPTLEMRPNPHTPHVRDVDVKFQGGKVPGGKVPSGKAPSGKAPSGKVNELTIRLVPKGTTKLGR